MHRVDAGPALPRAPCRARRQPLATTPRNG